MSKKEKLSTESYKGVRDFYPEDQALLTYLTSTMRGVVEKAGYEEYGASLLEPAELYRSKGADSEEIIRDQSYTFVDRGGREVTLRPEMTPTAARMVARRRRELGYPLRWYSIPNCFRYERPQRGRLREFWQLNVDLFGSKSLAADAEIIGVAHSLMSAFGATESDFTIKLGSREYLNVLAQEQGLDEAQRRDLLLLLDRRAKMGETEFYAGLARLGIHKSRLSQNHPPENISQIIIDLKAAGIENVVYDPAIVRGFAYYTGIVFEVFDTHPENNRSLFGGGRYDNLTALFDDEPLPGVGFGMGDVTIRDFLAVRGLLPAYTPATQVYVGVTDPALALEAQALAGEMRRGGVNVAIDFGERKLGEQIKTASKHKIPWLVVVGPDELASGRFVIRNLESGAEEGRSREELAAFFLSLN